MYVLGTQWFHLPGTASSIQQFFTGVDRLFVPGGICGLFIARPFISRTICLFFFRRWTIHIVMLSQYIL